MLNKQSWPFLLLALSFAGTIQAQMTAAQRQAQIQQQQAAQERAREAQIEAQQEAAQERAREAQIAAQQQAAREAQIRNQQIQQDQYRATASTPRPSPSDLGLTRNYVEPVCSDGTTTAHYQVTNNSYSNASVTVGLSYRAGGTTSSYSPTLSVPARSSQDFSIEIPCGGDPQMDDYGNGGIRQWQFE